MDVDLLEKLARDRRRELLGVVALHVAGKFAVEIELVDWRKAMVDGKSPHVGHGEKQDSPLQRARFQRAIELEDGLRAGILVAVDAATDANRRAVLLSDELVQEQHRVAAIG